MSNDLSSLLSKGVVLSYREGTSRKQVVHLLAGALADELGLSGRDIEEAVMTRERLGSTGVGEGVAIPHARIAGLAAPVGAFVNLQSGVDFEAIDDRPCDLIFMLLAPEAAGADHLRALAQVSRALREAKVRDALRAARSPQDILTILCSEKADQVA